MNIGSNIIDQAQKEFKLSQIPIPGTLKVSVNGSQLVQGGANGFLYHADRNTIELRGTALTNAAGGNVVADYMYL